MTTNTKGSSDGAAKGPAAYFPSIEKTYGQPIEHWTTLISGCALAKHMEIVNWLKTEHGLGHGHANALVATPSPLENSGLW